MRFLCLHGIGTNSQLFKMQTAAVRYELGDDHTYEFVQGTVEWPMAPELAEMSNPNVKHYAYFDPKSVASYVSALDALDEYVTAEGPFDAVMGFSQGAGLAVMYLVRHNHEHPNTPLPFKCAVLMSRIGVYDPVIWLKTGEVTELAAMPFGEPKLGIPVAAIWGEKDFDEAAREAGLTSQLFEKGGVWNFVHAGGHEVPGLNVADSVKGSVKAIRRAVTSAMFSES